MTHHPSSPYPAVNAFRQGLREHGYIDGNFERGASLALELVGLKVNLIFVGNTPLARAAQQATKTIPIVVPIMSDPVGDGLVASLAHPGGNIRG